MNNFITSEEISIAIYKELLKLNLSNLPSVPKIELICPSSRMSIGKLKFIFNFNNKEKSIEFDVLVSNILDLRLKAENAIQNYQNIISCWLAN